MSAPPVFSISYLIIQLNVVSTLRVEIEQNLNQIKQIIILQNLNKICRISRRRRPKLSVPSVQSAFVN